jgi:membrane-associated protein
MFLIASIFDVAEDLGYPLIFLIVVMETGCGIPFAPGELATITGGIAAAEGELKLEWVLAYSAAGAVVGDNIGYMIGRVGGRRLLEREGLFYRQRQRVLSIVDPFFERHGPKTVFIGRWLPVLRVYTSWLAGASRMPWKAFAVWNAAGGIAWAISMGVLGYWGGAAAKTVIEDTGKYGVALVVLVLVTAYLVYRRQQRHAVDWVRRHSQPDLPTISPADESGAGP